MRVPRAKKKRKIWPYFLVTFLIIVIGVAGFILYEFKFKQYDVADPVIDKILEEDFVINFPDGEQLIINKDGEIVETASKTIEETLTDSETTTNQNDVSNATNSSSNTENQNSTSSNNQSTTEKNEKPKNNQTVIKPTVDSITAKYMPTLEALETQANAKINGIIEQAKQEYRTKKSNGESISYGYFYNKYYGAATQLESRTDRAFNSIVSLMENELENNGFATENVQTLREQYKTAKETRKSTLMNKALELF